MNIISNRLRALSRGMALVCALSVALPASQAQAWALPDTLKRYAQSLPGMHAAATFVEANKNTVRPVVFGIGVALGSYAAFVAYKYISKHWIKAKPSATQPKQSDKPVVEVRESQQVPSNGAEDNQDNQVLQSSCNSGRFPGGQLKPNAKQHRLPYSAHFTFGSRSPVSMNAANNNVSQQPVQSVVEHNTQANQPLSVIEQHVEQIEEAQQDQQPSPAAIVAQPQAESDKSLSLLQPTELETHELGRKQAEVNLNKKHIDQIVSQKYTDANMQALLGKTYETVKNMQQTIQEVDQDVVNRKSLKRASQECVTQYHEQWLGIAEQSCKYAIQQVEKYATKCPHTHVGTPEHKAVQQCGVFAAQYERLANKHEFILSAMRLEHLLTTKPFASIDQEYGYVWNAWNILQGLLGDVHQKLAKKQTVQKRVSQATDLASNTLGYALSSGKAVRRTLEKPEVQQVVKQVKNAVSNTAETWFGPAWHKLPNVLPASTSYSALAPQVQSSNLSDSQFECMNIEKTVEELNKSVIFEPANEEQRDPLKPVDNQPEQNNIKPSDSVIFETIVPEDRS